MKKGIILIMLMMWCSITMAAQQKNDYVSPNFNSGNIHNIVIIGQTPNEALPYIVDDSLIMSLPGELKKELSVPNVKVDTMMEVVVKVQKITGNNILAMMQSQDVNQQQQAINQVWDYINRNYDTIINVGILQANYTQQYSNGYTYTTTEHQTSTIRNVYGNIATVDTPVQREHTIGRGMVNLAQVTLNISVQNSSEIVMQRKEFRNKISSGVGATTPYDIGKRIVGSFAHDFSKKMNSK